MNTEDATGVQTERQTRHRSTKNKMERSTAPSRVFTGQDPGVLPLFTFMTIIIIIIIIIIVVVVVVIIVIIIIISFGQGIHTYGYT
jgi:hypothetical protein